MRRATRIAAHEPGEPFTLHPHVTLKRREVRDTRTGKHIVLPLTPYLLLTMLSLSIGGTSDGYCPWWELEKCFKPKYRIDENGRKRKIRITRQKQKLHVQREISRLGKLLEQVHPCDIISGYSKEYEGYCILVVEMCPLDQHLPFSGSNIGG